MTQIYQRTLPVLTDDNRHFWTSGEHGQLKILRCQSCQHWIHPPRPVCPACYGRDVKPEAVSGLATVFTFTLNMRAWGPGLEVPYVIAIVALDEQPGLQLTTNIVGCKPEDVRIGMRVKVVFEQDEDVWIPQFTPVDA